jgi:hypothetical protein
MENNENYYVYTSKKELVLVTPLWESVVAHISKRVMWFDASKCREAMFRGELYENSFYVATKHVYPLEVVG